MPESHEGTPDSDLDHNSVSEETPALKDEETDVEIETPLQPTQWPAVNEPVKAAGSQTGIIKLAVDPEEGNAYVSITIELPIHRRCFSQASQAMLCVLNKIQHF